MGLRGASLCDLEAGGAAVYLECKVSSFCDCFLVTGNDFCVTGNNICVTGNNLCVTGNNLCVTGNNLCVTGNNARSYLGRGTWNHFGRVTLKL